jgi:peptide/nickel transport system permease protein
VLPSGGLSGVRSLRRIGRAVTSNGKALAGAVLLAIFIFVGLFPGLIAHDNPEAEIYGRSVGLSSAHLLGTTAFGQDMFSQVIYGARPVLLIAFGAGFGATIIAMLIGVAAAYLGGAWDSSLNLLTDVLLVIPAFPLLIIIGSYLHGAGTGVMIAVITFVSWSYTARQLRAQAQSLRNRDFLLAAKVRGERAFYIIMVEMIPTMTSLLLACFLTNALYAVLAGSGLQFLGLGDPSMVSWGTTLYWADSQGALQSGLYLWEIVPGLCIALLGAAFALLNYAFDEISNPALRPLRTKKARKRAALAIPVGRELATDDAHVG